MQTYATHRARPDVTYSIIGVILVLNALWCIYVLGETRNLAGLIGFVVSLALFYTLYAARRHAQIVQDRVIRLEMRLRCERLGVDLTGLPLPFIVALRFAGDGELPALAAKARSGAFATPDALKQAITDWQEDTLRV